jgi:crotonobetainyl-CoA:carnitine CoA-transferase CaiB-like acyl-CoA transferase
VTVPGIPVKLSQTPGRIERRAPRLGEHTDVILSELRTQAK